jgi:glucan-binding YG repeat protein
VDIDYDVRNQRYVCYLATNEYRVVGGSLYYFNASGSSKGAISANGWYKAGSDWYYFRNGTLIEDGYQVIDGAGYHFYNGCMTANQLEWTSRGIHYFGADGKHVTKEGWYKVHDEWIYVDRYGKLCEHGVYKIGGKEYTFQDYILISE